MLQAMHGKKYRGSCLGDLSDPCHEMPRNITSAHLPLAGIPSLECHLATPNSREAGKWRVSGDPRRREISSGKLAISNREQRNNSLYTEQKMESSRRTLKSSQVDWKTRQEPAECWVGSREQEGLIIWPECRGFSAFWSPCLRFKFLIEVGRGVNEPQPA